MSEKEKQVRGCLIILLEAARKMTKTVSKPSDTLKQLDQDIAALIKRLSDTGPDVC